MVDRFSSATWSLGNTWHYTSLVNIMRDGKACEVIIMFGKRE